MRTMAARRRSTTWSRTGTCVRLDIEPLIARRASRRSCTASSAGRSWPSRCDACARPAMGNPGRAAAAGRDRARRRHAGRARRRVAPVRPAPADAVARGPGRRAPPRPRRRPPPRRRAARRRRRDAARARWRRSRGTRCSRTSSSAACSPCGRRAGASASPSPTRCSARCSSASSRRCAGAACAASWPDALEAVGARRRDDGVRLVAWRLDGGGDVDPELVLNAARLALLDGDDAIAERLIRRARGRRWRQPRHRAARRALLPPQRARAARGRARRDRPGRARPRPSACGSCGAGPATASTA